MKKIIKTSLLVLVFLAPICASAQMDNLANMSAKWIRANARNAALDGADIVNYNPAGLVQLNDGVYVSLNNQTLFRKPQHSFNLGMGAGNQSYEQDGADLFLPSLYLAFKKDKWAMSTGVYITGGGASADYPEGSVNTTFMGYKFLSTLAPMGYSSFDNQNLKASSYYLSIPLSVSYLVTEQLSVSVGGRYVIANNHTKAGMVFHGISPDYSMTVDYKNEAIGFGGIIGLNYSISEKLNVAIHYETKVNLDFKAKDNKGSYKTLVPDGTKSTRDLPAVLYTGASYKFTDKFTAAFDFNYYFQKNADWGKFSNNEEISDAAGDCYHVALGTYYQLLPKLQLSAGAKYIHFGYSDQEQYYTQLGAYEAVKYDNFNIGIGAGYNVTENIQVDLGVGRTFWSDKTIKAKSWPTNPDVNISNGAYVFALGVDLKF